MTEPQDMIEDGIADRRAGADRRLGLPDTRADKVERREGWDRRRGPGRRRTDERRAAEEGEMNDEQFEFIMAINSYKQANRCSFPSYTEILEIAKALGYRKVAEPQPLKPPATID
jgi:hypothetical protein